jgi:uncharacterized protein involved in exopolysaccharide biosynthesis
MRPVIHREAIPHDPAADNFDLRRSWQAVIHACRPRLRMIGTTMGVAIALTLAYILIWPPVYVADVTLIASSPNDPQRDAFYDGWNVFRHDEFGDDVQLFTSRPVLAATARRLDLRYADIYHPPVGYATWLWTQSWPGQAWKGIKNFVHPRPSGPGIATPEQIDFARTLDDMRKGISLAPVAGSNVGHLVVLAPSPRAAQIANTLVDVYLAQRRTRFADEANSAYRALADETAKAHDALLASEAKMARYYTEGDMTLLVQADQLEVGQMMAQRAAIVDARGTIADSERQLAEVQRQLGSEKREIVSARVIGMNPVREAMRDKLAQLRLSRATMLIHYLPTAPEIAEIDRQIAATQARMDSEAAQATQQTSIIRSTAFEALRARRDQLQADLAGARAALSVKLANAGTLEAHVAGIPEQMKVSHDLGREHDALEKTYSTLQDKLAIARVSVASARSAPPSISVVDYAAIPNEASAPRTKLLLIAAALAGLIAGCALAVLIDQLQGAVTRSRLARQRGALPIYATIQQDPVYVARLFPTLAPRTRR